jgi:hypothetical protein
MVSADAQVSQVQDPKVRARTLAAIAYDTAAEMYGTGKFRDAGVMFLKADLLDPSAAALIQAFKAYRLAGDRQMVDLINKQFKFRYSDRQLLVELDKEGLVCVSKWELEALRSRLATGQSMVDDWLKSRKLTKLPDNPYHK